jgi:hypothetical protein
MHSSRWIRILAMASMLALLAACGGGKGDSSAQSGSAQNAGGPESGAASAGTSAGTASQAETAPPPPGADAPEIVLSHGAPIDLTEHLIKGQINIIDFYSKYCGPCRQIAPHLRRMDQERDDLTVIKVDINRPGVTGIDWGSPVARQFELHSVPHFRVYDAQGRLLADGRPAYQMVIDYLQGKS